MKFSIYEQDFYSGLAFKDLNSGFVNRTEMFDFLPNDKYLLLENAVICGIKVKIKVTFTDDELDSIIITALENFEEMQKEYHSVILRSFFGEPNAENKSAAVFYRFGDITAGNYISYKNSTYIDIRFTRRKKE